MTLRWKSNNAAVADRAFTIARVVGGEIELMPDPKTGAFVEVYIDNHAVPAVPPEISEPIVFEVESSNG